MKLSRICIFLVIISSCNSEETILPIVKTKNPTLITPHAAILTGSLTKKGSEPISDHGFVWSTTPNVSASNGTMISLSKLNNEGDFETLLEGTVRDKKYYYSAFVKTNDRLFQGNEIEFTAGAHTINTITPTSSIAGETITISGHDFVSDPSQIIVKVGGFTAAVTNSTENEIIVTIPEKITGGNKDVVVIIEDVAITYSSPLTIVPVFESISSTWGFAKDTLEIFGSGFGSKQEVTVKFNSNIATVVSSVFNSIIVTVPTNSGGENSISISVNSIACPISKNINVLAWKKLTDLPLNERYAASSFIINTKLYVGLGASLNGNRYKDFWEVDLESGAAKQLKDFPGTGRFETNFFTIENKGYIVLGYDAAVGELDELWEYDPTDDSWTKKQSFPGGSRMGAVSFVLNGKAYVGCGIDNGITSKSDVYQYDPGANEWQPATAFAGGQVYGQGSFVMDNKAYVIAGVKDNTDIINEVWEFNGSSWLQRANYPGQLITDGLGFNFGGFGFIGFGWINNNTAGVENWRYKPSANHWKKLENFPGPSRFSATSGSSSKYWYFGLGYKGNTMYKDLWIIKLPL